jgi:hypothetical protein
LLVEGVDPPEQRGVLQDLVVVGGQQRLHLRFHRLHRVVGEGAGENPVDRLRPVARPPRRLQRDDGVGEGRRRRVRGDAVYFAKLLRHRGEQRWLQVRDRHLVERRNAAERAGPGRGRDVHVLAGRGLRKHGRGAHGRRSGEKGPPVHVISGAHGFE